MRKLTKKALSLVLCAMLIVSAIGCVFSISAETVGTTTITAPNGNEWLIYDAPVGLELDGDLSTWINNNIAPSGTPLYVSENGVLKAADGMAEVNAWEEVGPARFKIPGAVSGTRVKISFDYNVNLDNLATDELKEKAQSERLNNYLFKLYNADGTVNTEIGNNLWYTSSGSTISKEFTLTDPDQFFRIIIGSCKSCRAAWEISNIKVEVTTPQDEDSVGTSTVEGKTYIVYNEPVDLELDGDMSSWINNNIAPSGTPLYVSANGVLRAADGMAEVNAWEEVGPARFKIPGAVSGTRVKISFDYNVNLDNLATDELKEKAQGERLTNYIFRLYNPDGSTDVEATKNLWYTDSGKTLSAEFTLTDPDQFFRIIIGSCKSCRAAWEISNITVTVLESSGGSDDEVQDEEITTGSTTIEKGWVVYDAPVEIGLTSTLKTWLGNKAPTGASLYVAKNGVLKGGQGILDMSNAWEEAGPARFKVPGVEVGSTVKISFDFAVNTEGLADDIKTRVESGERLLWPIFKQYTADGTMKVEQAYDLSINTQGTLTQSFVVADPDEFYRIIFRSAKSLKDAWEISNITVTVSKPNTSGIPTYYGTEEDGFNSKYSSYPLALKPVDTIENLDFSDGFIYWSGRDAGAAPYTGTFASNSFALVTEGENKYITLTEDGYVNTMRTALFKVEGVHVGEKLVLVYDVKGADANKLRVTLLQHHLRGEDQGVVYDETTGLNTDTSGKSATPGTPTYLVNNKVGRAELVSANAAGWATFVTDYSDIISDPTQLGGERPCTSDIYLQVVVDKAPSVLAGDQLDVAIDNIRIAKVVDGMYYDVATGAEIAPEVVHEYPEENAETLANMVAAILAGDPSVEDFDFNYDGKVDLLDVVALKKYLAEVL